MSGRRSKRLLLLALCGVLAVLFTGLGIWQVERLQWKRDLIARVEARLAAAPVPVPPQGQWDRLDPKAIEYRKVRVSGSFDHGRETRVDALTELGPGWWILTPLHTSEGTILINRGFVPKTGAYDRSPAPRQITGLIRLSEPGGRFLRPNKPASGLWYSRDVEAIARARGLSAVAPFFIDADASANPGGWPRGGLTVVHFRNAHLVYALTWFGLALLSLFGLVVVWKSAARRG